MKKFFCVLFLTFFFVPCFSDSWYICLGSFQFRRYAQIMQNDLQKQGFETFIDPVFLEDGMRVYRILWDKEFPTYVAAEKARHDWDERGVIKAPWICRVSSDSKTEQTVQTKSVQPKSDDVLLEKNDEFPVSKEKPYSILVQTYKEEQSAENDKDRLIEKDIDAYILRKFDEKDSFTFDLHVGAATTKEELEPLEQKLSDLNIPSSEIADYNDFASQLQKYDEVVQNHDVVFGSGVDSFPNNLSENVILCLNQFPVNRNFSIEKIQIYDMDNIKQVSKEYGEDLLTEYVKTEISENVSAFSYAEYKDDLFRKSVKIFIAVSNSPCFDVSFDDDSIEEKIDFSLDYGTLNSYVLKNESGYLLTGSTQDKKLFVCMKMPDFSADELKAFLKNYKSDSSLLVYPQIRKTFCILPEGGEREFLFYNLEKIGMDYAEKRGYVDWSMKIVGHWEASFYFNQNDEIVSASVFDLDYDYNARSSHELFKTSHNSGTIGNDNHLQMVKNIEGWYVSNLDGNEVSFSTKSYIFAINSYSFLGSGAEELTAVAEDLKIWE